MRIDYPGRPPRTARSNPSARLREELQVLAGGHAEIRSHSEKNWASVTFAGARHRLELAFAGEQAVEAAENFIAFLPEHEFSIRGRLVADAAVVAVDHRIAPEPRMDIQVELLLLDEE